MLFSISYYLRLRVHVWNGSAQDVEPYEFVVCLPNDEFLRWFRYAFDIEELEEDRAVFGLDGAACK